MNTRKKLGQSRRWVVKVGSSILTNDGQGLDRKLIAAWAAQIARLRQSGIEIVLVSSGAVSEGMARMGWRKRPHALHQLQAAAAIGQMGLVQTYETIFQVHDLHTAQILVTHDDLSDRQRYLDARSTLQTLLTLGVIPVVNENDTVASQELRFGDNDTLAAMVANLIDAELLVLLTDQPGMYEDDPRTNPGTPLITEARADDEGLEQMAAGGGVGRLGSGGMLTKVLAARRAAQSGAATIIAAGRQEDVLLGIAAGEDIGTLIVPAKAPLVARKQWLASRLELHGSLVLDAGAVEVLRRSGRSLLAVGVTRVAGDFRRGELVACLDAEGRQVARGLVNYNAEEAGRIAGHASDQIETLLGYVDEPELIHRDNLVVL